MSGRTFVVGDIHGEIEHLDRVMSQFPTLDAEDTLVFLGDYVDRGPRSKEVVEAMMSLPSQTSAKVVCLRGNHEDAWLRVLEVGWDEFVLPSSHGCLAMLRSYIGGLVPAADEEPSNDEMSQLSTGTFLPVEVAAWMKSLPFWYEDAHGIYVHAGLPRGPKGYLHPSEVEVPAAVAWVQKKDFVLNYRGKNVFFGHTPTTLLPQEVSLYTPEDSTDMFETEDTFDLDTGCGIGGFLTAIELPSMQVYESR